MSDIVERLRKNFKDKYPAWVIQGEAADEIERLRSALDVITGYGTTGEDALAMIAEAREALFDSRNNKL